MTDLTPSTETEQSDNGQMALAIYILYLVGFVTGGLTVIIGLVLAYVYKDNAPEWLKSHYENAIHIFWKGLLYILICLVLSVIIIGAFLFLVQAIWFIVRCAKGLQGVSSRTPYPNPTSWGF